MISAYIMGGLGNMLFQVAAGFAHSLLVNDEFCISDSNMSQMKHTSFRDYEDNIFRNVPKGSPIGVTRYDELTFAYNSIPKYKDMILSGYFQSEKYFIEYEKEIRSLFSPPKEVIDYLGIKYGDLGMYTSLHVRRGDYVNQQAYHPTCSIDYYMQAIEKIGAKDILIFSDDIAWCRSKFKGHNYTFVSGNLDYQDLYLMSMCKSNIIANSSFSWWGAWLGNNTAVVAPANWFGSSIAHSTEDLYPPSWVII
jgi:hypothetical protein